METMENVQPNPEKTGFMKGVGKFFAKNYALFVSPFLVICLFVAALCAYGVYPFGNRYTLASYDLSAQICPFVEHFFDVFQGKSTLTYSYAIMGGVDVTGSILYFFLSPFSFLFFLFGDGRVMQTSSIVLGAKLATVAVAGTWFAKKLFKGIPDYICIAIGVAYAFCGYAFVASTYINWVDFLIYLPFCAGAFVHFVKTGKFLIFALLMACCIYTCFSLACFSMFIVFPALIFYGLMCVGKEGKYKFLAKLCLAFATAVLLALPLLLPAFAAVMRSARGGGLFEGLWYGFKTVTEGVPSEFDSSKFMDSWTDSMYAKWSYIFADSVFVALTLIWFYRKGLKDNFSKFMLVAGVLTLLPLVVDESMKLLNMGSYYSYALRFGFLNALYFLGGACLCIENLCYTPKKAFDGTPLFAPLKEEKTEEETVEKPFPKKKYWLWLVAAVVVGLIAVGFLVWYSYNDNYRVFLSMFSKDKQKAMDNLSGFASSYAHSYGGLEVVIVLFTVVTALALIGGYLVSEKKISPRLLSYILIAVVGVQVVFYGFTMVEGNTSTQHEQVGTYQVLSEELNSRNEDLYFRVKDYGKVVKNSDGDRKRDDCFTANIPFTGNSNAFSSFSSVIDKDNYPALELFGYIGNGKNTFKTMHNYNEDVMWRDPISDEFGDSFMGYKYFIVLESQRSYVDKEVSWLKKVMVTDENGEETYLMAGEDKKKYYVYENTIVFPSAYRVDSGEYRFVAPNDSSASSRASNRRKNQAALYEFLRGKDLLEFTNSERVSPTSAKELSEYLWSKAAEVEVGAGKITARVTPEKEGECLFLNFVASKGYSVTVNGKRAELIENDLNFLSVELEYGKENVVVFEYSSPYVKYALVGAVIGLIGLCALALVLKKTRLLDYTAPVIAWAGIVLALGVVGFFMIFPTGVFGAKLIELLKSYIFK